MAIAIKQIQEFIGPTAGATSITVSMHKPFIAGNSVIVLAFNTNLGSNTTITASDTEGNTYTSEVTGSASNGTERFVATVLRARNISVTGGVDVTVSFNAVNSWFGGAIIEVSGLADAVVDKTGTNSGTSTGPNVTASGANSQADMLVCGAMSTSGTLFTGPTTGYQPVAFWDDYNNITAGHAALKIVSASETSAATWTQSGSTQWAAAIATFKADAAATKAPIFRRNTIIPWRKPF